MSLNKTILHTFLTQASVQFLGVVSGVFIARMIGPEGKGVFAIYQANAQLLITFFSLSFGNILTYFIPSGKIKPEKMLGISLMVIFFGSLFILGFILFLNYSEFKIYFFPSKYCSFLYILWIFLFSILSIVNIIASGFFQGLKMFHIDNRVAFINSILNVLVFGGLFIIYFLNLYEIDVKTLLYCLLALTFINTIQYVFPFILVVKVKPDFKISYKRDIKPIFSFVIYTHLGLFVTFFNNRFSLWVLNYFLNETAIGLYSLAANFALVFNMISMPIGNVLMPYLSSENKSNKDQMFYKYSRINFTIIFMLGTLAFFLCYFLIPLIYGVEFTGAVILFQLLLPGILFASIGRIFAVYIAANNKQLYNLYASIVGFIANIILSYLLIMHYGVIGASIAGSITFIFTTLTMMYLSHFKLNLRFGNYLLMSPKEIRSNLKTGIKSYFSKKQE